MALLSCSGTGDGIYAKLASEAAQHNCAGASPTHNPAGRRRADQGFAKGPLPSKYRVCSSAPYWKAWRCFLTNSPTVIGRRPVIFSNRSFVPAVRPLCADGRPCGAGDEDGGFHGTDGASRMRVNAGGWFGVVGTLTWAGSEGPAEPAGQPASGRTSRSRRSRVAAHPPSLWPVRPTRRS